MEKRNIRIIMRITFPANICCTIETALWERAISLDLAFIGWLAESMNFKRKVCPNT